MSGELHEAINAIIVDKTWVEYEWTSVCVAGTGLAADAVLAMPEMQAIRGGILALFTAYDWDRERCAEALREWGFPQSVIDWVLP